MAGLHECPTCHFRFEDEESLRAHVEHGCPEAVSAALTYKQKHEIPITVTMPDSDDGLVVRYGECGSHELVITGIIDLEEAKRLHEYLGSLPGVLPVHPALPQPPVKKDV